MFTAGAMASTNVLTSPGWKLHGARNVSVQAVWTGTPTGTFTFQVTDHPMPYLDELGRATPVTTTTDNTAATWTTLTNPTAFTALQPAGSATNAEFGFADVGGGFFRVKYTNSSGTGTLDAWMNAR
jgi:hypothetical protein